MRPTSAGPAIAAAMSLRKASGGAIAGSRSIGRGAGSLSVIGSGSSRRAQLVAPEKRLDPRPKNFRDERFGEIIVGADI